MKRVGITGHQRLDVGTAARIRSAIDLELSVRGPICGVGSLASGADQLFAERVLCRGGTLIAVIPSVGYEASFVDLVSLARYRRLLARATEVAELPFPAPTEEAFRAAGKRVVDLADEVLAVWDGTPSEDVGGTADIVAFARGNKKPVTRIWPPGAGRDT